MRKLASIRNILEIRSIEGADLIEIAVIDGWQVIVKKGEFKVADLAVYFEIDSFLPVRPEFEFLRKNCFKIMNNCEEGFRLKTMKLRGAISQGLLLPISEFKELRKVKLGDDVTDILKVKLYEPPTSSQIMPMRKKTKFRKFLELLQDLTFKICPPLARYIFPPLFRKLYGERRLGFPRFVPKTDEERIQNLVSKLPELSQNTYEVSIKLDGSSLTVFKRNKEAGVCSRNLLINKNDKNNNYNRIEQKYDIISKLHKYGKNIAIQGEMFGEGIQGNPEKIKGIDFRVFNIYDIDNCRYVNTAERLNICAELELNHVPILHYEFSIDGMNIEDFLKMAEGESLHSNCREGIVFKANNYVNNYLPSFKCISNKYLLKQED